jgi:DNA-directed RNA polymerase specialized sigma24 family protein
MSKSDVIVPHLPYLRRYARALTGSQTSGDAYVAATLEAIVKEPDLLGTSQPARVTLYRLFSTIWNSLSVNDGAEQVMQQVAAERHLNRITAKPRQAFLLISVEGFSEEHASRILDVDITVLRKLVEDAGRELAAQIATDVLIIEDEALIALDLEALVENLGHKVVGVAWTGPIDKARSTASRRCLRGPSDTRARRARRRAGGLVSKRLSAPDRSGPSQDWLKIKNPDSPAMIRARKPSRDAVAHVYVMMYT